MKSGQVPKQVVSAYAKLVTSGAVPQGAVGATELAGLLADKKGAAAKAVRTYLNKDGPDELHAHVKDLQVALRTGASGELKMGEPERDGPAFVHAVSKGPIEVGRLGGLQLEGNLFVSENSLISEDPASGLAVMRQLLEESSSDALWIQLPPGSRAFFRTAGFVKVSEGLYAMTKQPGLRKELKGNTDAGRQVMLQMAHAVAEQRSNSSNAWDRSGSLAAMALIKPDPAIVQRAEAITETNMDIQAWQQMARGLAGDSATQNEAFERARGWLSTRAAFAINAGMVTMAVLADPEQPGDQVNSILAHVEKQAGQRAYRMYKKADAVAGALGVEEAAQRSLQRHEEAPRDRFDTVGAAMQIPDDKVDGLWNEAIDKMGKSAGVDVEAGLIAGALMSRRNGKTSEMVRYALDIIADEKKSPSVKIAATFALAVATLEDDAAAKRAAVAAIDV